MQLINYYKTLLKLISLFRWIHLGLLKLSHSPNTKLPCVQEHTHFRHTLIITKTFHCVIVTTTTSCVCVCTCVLQSLPPPKILHKVNTTAVVCQNCEGKNFQLAGCFLPLCGDPTLIVSDTRDIFSGGMNN